MAHGFQFLKHIHGVLVSPFRQQHHVIPISLHAITIGRIDDDGAVHACHFLKCRMGVVPVGATLLQFEAILESFTWGYTGETNTWNAVHLVGQDEAMPVN